MKRGIMSVQTIATCAFTGVEVIYTLDRKRKGGAINFQLDL